MLTWWGNHCHPNQISALLSLLGFTIRASGFGADRLLVSDWWNRFSIACAPTWMQFIAYVSHVTGFNLCVSDSSANSRKSHKSYPAYITWFIVCALSICICLFRLLWSRRNPTFTICTSYFLGHLTLVNIIIINNSIFNVLMA